MQLEVLDDAALACVKMCPMLGAAQADLNQTLLRHPYMCRQTLMSLTNH